MGTLFRITWVDPYNQENMSIASYLNAAWRTVAGIDVSTGFIPAAKSDAAPGKLAAACPCEEASIFENCRPDLGANTAIILHAPVLSLFDGNASKLPVRVATGCAKRSQRA
jgi:hypothetical protein